MIKCDPFRWRAENCRDIQEAVVAAAAADAEARQHGFAAEPVRVLLRQQRTAETAAGATTGAEAGTGTVSNCNSLACFIEHDVIATMS